MNVFNAIEIYKRTPGVPSDQNPLRPVRGFWVSGTHTEPFFIDSVISIKTTTSNNIEVVKYTQTTQDLEVDNGLTFAGFYDGGLPYTDYSKTSVEEEFGSLSFMGLVMDDIYVTTYLTERLTFQADTPHIEIYGFQQQQTPTYTVQTYPVSRDESIGPEPILNIKSHFSSDIEYN